MTRPPTAPPRADTPLRRDRAQRHQRARHAIDEAVPARDEHVIDLTDPLQPVESFPPHLARSEITAEAVAERLRSAGCVLLEGLIPRPAVDGLIASIDRAFAGYDQHDGRPAANDPWFDAFIPKPSIVHATRSWLREAGGLFAVDSPNTFGCWFELLEEAGMTTLVEELFGEMPVTSLDKCSLRRVRPGDGIEWHQDGAFLGLDAGALDLWVSLSDTATSPGLDLLGRRCVEIVETGTGSATYPWSVGPELVAEMAADSPIIRPRFLPGDALLFDGLLLHRTSPPTPDTAATRYAIETWFFRPSRFPDHQEVPIAF